MALSKLSFAPHRIRVGVGAAEPLRLWWSNFPPSFHPERTIFDYWGDDVGDLRFLWKYLQPGMTFLDIGAYRGIYSLVAAKKLGAAGRVIAFEPSPRERDRMRLHLKWNGIDTVTVEPYAIAATDGRASLSVVVDGFTTMNSLRPPAVNDPIEQVAVDTASLDSYLVRNAIDRVDLLKIDVEGGENKRLPRSGQTPKEAAPADHMRSN